MTTENKSNYKIKSLDFSLLKEKKSSSKFFISFVFFIEESEKSNFLLNIIHSLNSGSYRSLKKVSIVQEEDHYSLKRQEDKKEPLIMKDNLSIECLPFKENTIFLFGSDESYGENLTFVFKKNKPLELIMGVKLDNFAYKCIALKNLEKEELFWRMVSVRNKLVSFADEIPNSFWKGFSDNFENLMMKSEKWNQLINDLYKYYEKPNLVKRYSRQIDVLKKKIADSQEPKEDNNIIIKKANEINLNVKTIQKMTTLLVFEAESLKQLEKMPESTVQSIKETLLKANPGAFVISNTGEDIELYIKKIKKVHHEKG